MYLFMPGFEEEVTWKESGYLLLDEVLGKYDVEMNVGPIGFFSLNQPVKEKRHPLAQLPEIFDRHVLTLRQRNDLPQQQPN
jgi:hypothetical protein